MRGRRMRMDGDGVFWGGVLLGLGAIFLLVNAGVLERDILGQWWVAIPLAMGVGRLITARTASAVSEGVFFLLIGAWFLIAVTGWMGLTWRNSWPLALIAVGASMLTEAIAGAFLPAKRAAEKEDAS